MKKRTSLLSVLLIACLLAGAFALAPSSSVLAMPEAQEGVDQALQKAYTAEQNWLGKQSTAIDKAYQAVDKVQELIDKAGAEGLDVSALQNALADFNEAMLTVEAHHQNAANALSAHAGFDEVGEVVGRASARQTVMDVRRALGEAHMSLTRASWDLHDAMRAWRAANFPRE